MVVQASQYKGSETGRAILAKALAAVQSVPYTVTARWLFYRLLQDGVYSGKDDYKCKFLPLITRARKAFYAGWEPGTLADDTREAIYRGFGQDTGLAWLRNRVCSLGCILDKWTQQPCYVEVWFEAAAMRSQFEYYTQHITLRPFKGDPSLDFKWQIARHLDAVAQRYPGKPIIILYFGDLDKKGLQIPESAAADVQNWCQRARFEFKRCGLNPGDEIRYSLPENIDKPGAYQWEALDDPNARDLILSHLHQYVDPGKFADVEEEEARVTSRFKEEIEAIIERWDSNN